MYRSYRALKYKVTLEIITGHSDPYLVVVNSASISAEFAQVVNLKRFTVISYHGDIWTHNTS